MLVLTRKPSEKIYIGENITITVVRINRNQVRLGIEAPPNTSVLREELALRTDHSSAPAKVAT